MKLKVNIFKKIIFLFMLIVIATALLLNSLDAEMLCLL